jgi:hypothetical protein
LLSGYIYGDIITFNSIMRGNYETPWYDGSFISQPYTYLQLSSQEHNDYWTKNAVGDSWYVRDVKYKGKTFWTILERVEH